VEILAKLRNRRLILRLHTIFRALIYWAHRAVIFAIAWLLLWIVSLAAHRAHSDALKSMNNAE